MICAIRWRKSRLETGYGRGIAAPQLGIVKRVIFLQLPGNAAWPLINPEMMQEECFLCIFMQVERYREITVRYQDVSGGCQEATASEEDDLSELLQHEIDHLDGIPCIDRVEDLRTICSKEEFEARQSESSPYTANPAKSRSKESPTK